MRLENNSAMTRALACLVMAGMMLQLMGCSFFASGRQPLTVSSSPGGAKVTINGERVGTTPVVYSISRAAEASILVEKEGYETQTRMTSKSLSGVGVVDVIGGCIILLPLLGLISDGAWKQEPANFSVALSKAEGKSE
jgi:hypothetical protein